MKESLSVAPNGLRVSRETEDRLELFVNLFLRWSKTINLVAPSTVPDVWQRHVVDSLQIYNLLPGPKRWIDLGSGGGFPGVVTAICLAEQRDGWVHLIESNNKKAAFLRTALAETGARGSVHPVRIEDAAALVPECDAISARALADLSDLLEYSSGWMVNRPGVAAFFHKGREYRAEVDKAVGRWQFDLVEHRSIVEPESVVLEITNLLQKCS